MSPAIALSLLISAISFAAPQGYVVKVEANQIYLDLGAGSGAQAGQKFTVFVDGDELKHPVTGKSLGKLEKTVARGVIEEVKEQYSIGRIEAVEPGGQPASGQKAKMVAAPAAAAAQPPAIHDAAAPVDPDRNFRASAWRSPAVSYEATGMTMADVNGDKTLEIVLIDATKTDAFPQDANKPLCRYDDTATGVRNLSVDAADLNGNGTDEVFTVAHNTFFGRIETTVLECSDGAFKKLATLPFIVRAYRDPASRWKLASQQVMTDTTFPISSIYELVYKNGKYEQGAPINLKRVDWLSSFALAKDGEDPFHMAYNSGGRLRVQFKRDSWSTREVFGHTSSQVRWYEKQLPFSPRIVTASKETGLTSVYLARNIASLAGLTAPFGIFNEAELQAFRWTGSALEPAWKAQLSGYAADIWAPADSSDIYVAVVAKSGKTSVWKFQP